VKCFSFGWWPNVPSFNIEKMVWFQTRWFSCWGRFKIHARVQSLAAGLGRVVTTHVHMCHRAAMSCARVCGHTPASRSCPWPGRGLAAARPIWPQHQLSVSHVPRCCFCPPPLLLPLLSPTHAWARPYCSELSPRCHVRRVALRLYLTSPGATTVAHMAMLIAVAFPTCV
jgi:hypothetical protein